MSSSIVLRDIDYSYHKRNKVLKKLNLTIASGEKVFIWGPSGSGKSTLLNLISGVLSPDSGDVVILDKDMHGLSRGQRDRFRGDHIGFVFQSFNLIPYLTIYENIILPLKTSKKRYRNLNGSIDEEVRRIAKQLKIDEFLDKRVTHLSVGQQQRVAVARALIGAPQIIVADEPTSSLDEDVTDNFMKLLLDEQKKKNFSLLFVSHDRRLAKFFDREVSLAQLNEQELSNA